MASTDFNDAENNDNNGIIPPASIVNGTAAHSDHLQENNLFKTEAKQQNGDTNWETFQSQT